MFRGPFLRHVNSGNFLRAAQDSCCSQITENCQFHRTFSPVLGPLPCPHCYAQTPFLWNISFPGEWLRQQCCRPRCYPERSSGDPSLQHLCERSG